MTKTEAKEKAKTLLIQYLGNSCFLTDDLDCSDEEKELISEYVEKLTFSIIEKIK